MFSLKKLNEALLLKNTNYVVEEFEPSHFFQMTYNAFDRKTIDEQESHEEMIAELNSHGHSIAFLHDKQILALFGFHEMWTGVLEVWMLPAPQIRGHVVTGHRAALRFFPFLASQYRAKRLQFAVCCTNVVADIWAKRCYFEREGLMRRYGPDGSDYFLYARLFDG